MTAIPQWSADELNSVFKGAKTSKPINDINERARKSQALFNANKVSDEYYTTSISWEGYLKTRRLYGCDAFEPFSGDGTPNNELGSLVNLKMMPSPWNFYEKIQNPKCPQGLVLTNPPFSFKYHVIITLLERRRSFAMILPWQAFAVRTDGRKKADQKWMLDEYEKKYGGKWRWFKMVSKETKFKKPKYILPDGRAVAGFYDVKAVGCHILEWDFENKYKDEGREIKRIN